jgi:hypothetical protein
MKLLAALKSISIPVTIAVRHNQGYNRATSVTSIIAVIGLLGSASSALAEGPDDFRRTFVRIAQSAPVQAPQGQLERQNPDPIGVQSSAYAVSGIGLGATVQVDSPAFKQYKCTPSDQFDGFTWCQKIRQEKERRGKFNSTYSILHSGGGVAIYIDRYLEPAFFGAREADDDIRQYSRNIGETPRIMRMPQRAGFPNGILALWGQVELEPLDKDSIEALAKGRPPSTRGYFIDFIGDFVRSAKEGLPLYRISGRAGFIWVASFDQRGRGTLRLTAVDASAFTPITTLRAPIETVEKVEARTAIADSTKQLSREDAQGESPDGARIDVGRAREDAEARDEGVTKTDNDQAAAIERPKVNALSAQLEEGAVEAEARAIEFVAYGAVIGLIVLVLIFASARSQQMQTAWLGRRPSRSSVYISTRSKDMVLRR